jgi:glycosyltransferase involved in cell wall biosynthesis
VGAIPSVLQNGEVGILVAAGDGAALADAMHCVLTEHADMARMAERAQAHASAHFSLDRMVEQYVELYRQEIDGSAKPVQTARSEVER